MKGVLDQKVHVLFETMRSLQFLELFVCEKETQTPHEMDIDGARQATATPPTLPSEYLSLLS